MTVGDSDRESGHHPRWAPDAVDIETPSAARMYDFFLGGSFNFASDWKLAEEYQRVLPDMPIIARAQRAVLHRAVRYLAEQGIDQFLDLGSGIPTGGNVHEIAQQVNPDARTVYVDVDPVAVAQATALLQGDARTGVIHADLRNTGHVMSQPVIGDLLDLTRPVGLLMFAVIHFLSDADDPAEVVGRKP
jgi:SAM-dependent methyltransferase